MNSKLKLILGVVGLVAVIGISAVVYPILKENYAPEIPLPSAAQSAASSGSTGEAEKVPAPDFTVVDSQGNSVKLSDFIGKPVVVNFWASWCPPCKAELPDFDKVWAELGEDVVFMMVNATDGGRETEEIAKDFLAKQSYAFPVYFDIDQEASYTYGVTSLPTTLFIDKDGYLVTGATSMIDEETLRKGIGMIQPQ